MNRYEFTGSLPITTLSGMVIACNFSRIVHGDRGAYVEFKPSQLDATRLEESKNTHYYYKEFFTIDDTRAKVYLQEHRVSYADYCIGMYYIAPKFLRGFISAGKLIVRGS